MIHVADMEHFCVLPSEKYKVLKNPGAVLFLYHLAVCYGPEIAAA